jgi:hypothetical protein
MATRTLTTFVESMTAGVLVGKWEGGEVDEVEAAGR